MQSRKRLSFVCVCTVHLRNMYEEGVAMVRRRRAVSSSYNMCAKPTQGVIHTKKFNIS